MIGEALLLIVAGIILFGGLKRVLLQLNTRDFVMMFLILLVVFGNLFNPIPLGPFFAVSLGSLVLIILSIVWLIRNIRQTGRYLPLISIAVIAIVSFVYQYILVNNTEMSIYLSMLVAVVGISAVALVMSEDVVEMFTTCVLGVAIGITLADVISDAQVVLGSNLMFAVTVVSGVLSVAVYYLLTALRRKTRKKYDVRFEAGKSQDFDKEKSNKEDNSSKKN
ncbi:MAG: hypothetical protein EOM87_05605 [Clostridia bacterium]|nr:hypothetical protein [Clostridia bacterium]